MPFDERVQGALQALRPQCTAFRAAVASAYAELHAYLATHAVRSDDRAREAAMELGRFASGRIDVLRFEAVVGPSRVLTAHEEATVRRCAEVMDEVLAQGDGIFTCEVPRGGDLRATVEQALAEAGRAFGAALVFQSVKSGVYRAEQHDIALRAFPFRRWNRNERMIAPPLVVSVEGAHLHAAALADYLDGREKIVLVVSGKSTPAPLARLVSPGLFVQQTGAADDLATLAASSAPGIAAIVPLSAVRFVHDPAAGMIAVMQVEGEAPRGAVGGWSVWQQEEELALLRRLAAADAVVTEGVKVDALASWLLAQSGIAGGVPA
jgi:hypothetical protein